MRRETTNTIRFILEELLPPILRDSRPMRWIFRGYWGRLVDDLEDFRSRAHHVGEKEYSDIYASLPRIQDGTDNSDRCISRIASDLSSGSVLDVGCGTGKLLRRLIAAGGTTDKQFFGVDIHVDDATRSATSDAELVEASVEALPFPDKHFDTVICTHVLEHILDIRSAVAELRRVCRGRLIVVIPKEREYRFTFNPHLHFFAYRHSFLKHMLPVPADACCERIGRDFYYLETVR